MMFILGPTFDEQFQLSDFKQEISAQVQAAEHLLGEIFPDDDGVVEIELDLHQRIKTKNFIAQLKQLLDQITFAVWLHTAAKALPEHEMKRKSSQIVYCYTSDETGFTSYLGKCLDYKRYKAGKSPPLELQFANWIIENSPVQNSDFASLTIIGELSRLHHIGLIKRKPITRYEISFTSSWGGGGKLEFSGSLGDLLMWAHRGIWGDVSGHGPPPPQYLNPQFGKIEIAHFRPDALCITNVPNVKTKIISNNEWRIQNFDRDASKLFNEGLQAAKVVIEQGLVVIESKITNE